MNLVGSGMDSGHSCVRVGSDGGLLVRITSIAQLKDLTNKNSFGVGGIGSTEECSVGGGICNICATKDFTWAKLGDSLSRVIEHIGINNYTNFIIDLIKNNLKAR